MHDYQVTLGRQFEIPPLAARPRNTVGEWFGGMMGPVQ